MRPSRCISQPLQEFTPSNSNNRLSRDVPSLFTFEGFPHPDQDSEGTVSRVRVHLLSRASSSTLEVPLGGHVIPDSPHSGRAPLDAIPPNASVAGPQTSDRAQISRDNSCHRDLLWWSDASHLVGGVPLDLPHPCLLLFTDASDTGWGAALGSDHLSGLWTPEMSLSSINLRELLAILYAICSFLHLLRGQSVSLFTDNTSALAYLRKQGCTKSATLHSMAQTILRLCETNDVLLLPQFVPGKLNVLADSFSRDSQVLGSEWTLCQVCQELFHRWSVNIDLFTTSMNNRLPAYFSLVVDPQALATNAMTQCWDGLQAYAFPPFGFIPNVLAKVRQSRNLEVTLVTPYWPLKPWSLDILELIVDIPVLLPRRRDLLRQPHFHHFHRNLPALHMTGFRIASERRVISASLRRWLDNLPSAAGLPLRELPSTLVILSCLV